jgi:predicted esterase
MRGMEKGLVLAAMAALVAACGDDAGGETPVDETSDTGGSDTGGSDVGGADAGGDAAADVTETAEPEGPTLSFRCMNADYEIAEGLNEGFDAGGRARSFYVSLPDNPDNLPVGVIFSWHGYGDSASNFHSAWGWDPDAIAGLPFIVVTPEDAGFFVLNGQKGLDWAIFESMLGDGNLDAAFFEGMLGCLDEQFELDSSHIHAFGFSAGAIFTNQLHARYPDVIASIVSISGAWFNDADTVENVNTMGLSIDFAWEDLGDSPGGAIFMSHGGPTDTFGIQPGQDVIDFELSASFAAPLLLDAERVVVDCIHSNGHQPHPQVAPEDYMQFFAENPAMQDSPYILDGLPDYFPSSCSLVR